MVTYVYHIVKKVKIIRSKRRHVRNHFTNPPKTNKPP